MFGSTLVLSQLWIEQRRLYPRCSTCCRSCKGMVSRKFGDWLVSTIVPGAVVQMRSRPIVTGVDRHGRKAPIVVIQLYVDARYTRRTTLELSIAEAKTLLAGLTHTLTKNPAANE